MKLQRLKPFFAVVLAFLIVFSSLCLPSKTVYAASGYPPLPSGLSHRYVLYYAPDYQRYVLQEIEFAEGYETYLSIDVNGCLHAYPNCVYHYNRWEYISGKDTDWRLVSEYKGEWTTFSSSPYVDVVICESSYVVYSDDYKTSIYFDPNSSASNGDFPYIIVLKQTFNQTGFQAFVDWLAVNVVGGVKKFFTGKGYAPGNIVYHTFYLTDKPRYVPATAMTNLYFIVEKGQSKSFVSHPNARTPYQNFKDADETGPFRFLAGGENDVNSKVEIVAINFDITDSAGNVIVRGDSSLDVDSLGNQIGAKLADDNAPTFEEFDPDTSLEDGFLNTASNFVDMITNGIKSIVQMFTAVGTGISELVNGYVPFLTQIFSFLPAPIPEILKDLFFLSVGLAIFRLIRG